MPKEFSLAEQIAATAPAAPRDIETITAEVLELKRTAGNAILDIGRRLIEAKAVLSHGEWLPWLDDRVEFSERTAQGFMALARAYSNPQTLADLGASKALALLALPEQERDDFVAATHVVGGREKTVDEMSTRELKQAIKERDEARAAQEKMSADMKFANERIEGLTADLELKTAEAEKARSEAERLSAELKELREKPQDVAIQEVPDQAAIEAAVKQNQMENDRVRFKLQQDIKAANEAVKKSETEAETRRKALEDKLAKAKEAQKTAEAERDALQAQLDAAREQAKKAEGNNTIAADAEIAQFKLLFDGIQSDINKMIGLLMKVRLRDAEDAKKLVAALNALADKIREGATA